MCQLPIGKAQVESVNNSPVNGSSVSTRIFTLPANSCRGDREWQISADRMCKLSGSSHSCTGFFVYAYVGMSLFVYMNYSMFTLLKNDLINSCILYINNASKKISSIKYFLQPLSHYQESI